MTEVTKMPEPVRGGKGNVLGKERALEILKWIVDSSPADQTEVGLFDSRSHLTRFTRNAIHQNVGEEDTDLWIRVFLGKKVGVVSTNRLTADAIQGALQEAITLARNQKELKEEMILPGPDHIQAVNTFSEATAASTPEQRARMLLPLFASAKGKGTELAGALQTDTTAMAVANSRGVEAYQLYTSSEFNLISSIDGCLGHGYARGRDVTALDLAAAEEVASRKALDGRNPADLEPGPYDVLLEPAALAAVFDWLGWFSFGAQAVDEGTSFLAGNEGEKLMGENVTIYDDGLEDPETAAPFDMEGVPKSRVVLVNKGVARKPVLDTYYAKRLGGTSTGHASGPSSGPFPWNLSMEGGDASYDDLLAGIERGLLVTRFHYVGLVEPRKAVMTGMTKDGTFLVENGKVVGPVKNMRFTQSIVEAFRRVEGLTKERKAFGSWGMGGGTVVPTTLIKDWTFTGKA